MGHRALFILFCLSGGVAHAGGFKAAQLHFPKVRDAYRRKEAKIEKIFEEKKISFPPQQIYLRAFKDEGKLEVWATNEGQYKQLTTFPICAVSGKPGPKRSQGDKQTPEGFYWIEQFNPSSSYHLSLKVSYPNAADKRLGQRNPGGNIYIHGGCGTRGCLPLTNDKVEELYLIVMEARDQGQKKIPIDIFPTRLNSKTFRILAKQYAGEEQLVDFWKTLQKGYEYFEKYKTPIPVFVNAQGLYVLQ